MLEKWPYFWQKQVTSGGKWFLASVDHRPSFQNFRKICFRLFFIIKKVYLEIDHSQALQGRSLTIENPILWTVVLKGDGVVCLASQKNRELAPNCKHEMLNAVIKPKMSFRF